ncbi:hypothetical protein Ancab_022086, partial [Ancistrocladus abbreviatus]
MIQLLFMVLFVEGVVAFLMLVKIGPLRELVMKSLDQVKMEQGCEAWYHVTRGSGSVENPLVGGFADGIASYSAEEVVASLNAAFNSKSNIKDMRAISLQGSFLKLLFG